MAIREGPKGVIDIIRGRLPEPFAPIGAPRSVTGELTGTELGGVAPIGRDVPGRGVFGGGRGGPEVSRLGVEASIDTGPSQAEKNKLRKDIERGTALRVTNLNRTFRDTRFTDRNLKLQAENKLAQDIADTKAQGKINLIEKGVITAFTFITTAGKEKVTSQTIPQFKQKIGLGEVDTLRALPETMISPTRAGPFQFIEPSTKNKIERFIRTKVPGGVTIVEKLKAGTETLKDIEKRFPTIGDFLNKEDTKLIPGFVAREEEAKLPGDLRVTIEEPTGTREQTFEEKLGIEPDKASQLLQSQVSNTQSLLAQGKITEEQADQQLDDNLEKFVTKKAIQNIPRNVALGIGLTALQLIPVVGQVATAGFVAAGILQRRRILSQIKNFPKATAISTASILAGGLVGNLIKGATISKVNKKIDPESLSSISGVTGKQKTIAIKQATQVDAGLKIAVQQGKITGFNVYDMVMKDGRKFRIVEFSKVKGALEGRLTGEKGLIGFQLEKALGERIIGRGVSVITDGKSQTFLRVLRFKPANTQIGRALQKFGFNKGKTIDILQKSKIVSKQGRVTQILSESRILSIKNTNRLLGKKINFIESKLSKGQRVSLPEIKNLINLERRSNGLKPFTESEFTNAGFSTITETIIAKALKKAELSFTKNIDTLKIVGKADTGLLGIAKTRPGVTGEFDVFVKTAKITKTPFSKTFGKQPLTTQQFSQQVAKLFKQSRTAGKQELARISRQIQNLKSRLTGSSGSLTLALANKLDQSVVPRVIPGAVPGVVTASLFGFQGSGSFSTARVLTRQEIDFFNTIDPGKGPSIFQRSLINTFDKGGFQSKIKTTQDTITKLKTLVKTKQRLKAGARSISLTNEAIATEQRRLQNFKQVQRLGQKLQQKVKQRQRASTTGVVTPALAPPLPIPKIPVPVITEEKPISKKRKPTIAKEISEEFKIFVRKAGKDIKLKTAKPLTTPTKARKRLKKELSLSLRASGFIVDSFGKRLTPKVSKGFRLSKTRPNVLVERRGRRLDSRTEVQAIKTAKKLAPRKPVKLKKNNPRKKPFNNQDGSSMSKILNKRKSPRR